MKKNLKKVISSAVALTLSLSSIAAFAASYTDVPATANYASAVNNLSALGIINGYEDGSFKPENKVTRAEVTKMVVAALAQTAAAESAKTATKFTDVAADHWAAGFINVGSGASGFINGMGDGTFAPESNVTYAQIVKMLVCTVGYGDMAVQYGGYPTGYMTTADSIGITTGVSANANDEVTREQVARLINNTLDTPLLVNTVWSLTNPEYEIKNGTGDDYQTLLTNKHKTYKVEGKVTNTSVTDPTGYDADEVGFSVESAKNFDGAWIQKKYTEDAEKITATIGDTKANEYLFSYSSALIKKDDDDTYRIISINPSGKNDQVSLSAGALDVDEYGSEEKAAQAIVNNEDMRYYATSEKTGTAKKYKTAGDKTDNEVELYVNGVSVDFNEENVLNYIVKNEIGTVTLIDSPQGGKSTTDGYYDYILVTYYKTGVIDGVSSAGRVSLSVNEQGMKKFDLDDDSVKDGDLQYSITLDGKEIKKSDLQEGDVISVAYDVNGNFEDSSFYTIVASRNIVEGKVTGYDSDDGYEVGGKNYKYYVKDEDSGIKISTEYSFKVDAFGRIVDFEELASATKYAILDNAYESSDGETYTIRMILPDGTVKAYEAKDEATFTKAFQTVYGDDAVVGSVSSSDKVAIEDRVVTYKVNTSNKVHTLATKSAIKKTGEYSERYGKIDSVKLNSAAQILDAEDYNSTNSANDIKTQNVSNLTDGSDYTVLAFDRANDTTYRFVIILEGKGAYNDDTQIAVFYKQGTGSNNNDEEVAQIEVFYQGKDDSVKYDMDPDVFSSDDDLGLAAGDAIVFQLNGDGEIKAYNTVFGANFDLGTSYSDFSEYVFDNYKDSFSELLTPVSSWLKNKDDKVTDSDCEIVFGPVIDKASKSFSVASAELVDTYVKEGSSYVKDGSVLGTSEESDQVRDITIGSDTKVYVYDFSKSTLKQRLTVGDASSIEKSYITKSDKKYDANGNQSIIDWTNEDTKASANFAFVRMVNEVAQEVIIILADDEN